VWLNRGKRLALSVTDRVEKRFAASTKPTSDVASVTPQFSGRGSGFVTKPVTFQTRRAEDKERIALHGKHFVGRNHIVAGNPR
jgi:hypothetical protein